MAIPPGLAHVSKTKVLVVLIEANGSVARPIMELRQT